MPSSLNVGALTVAIEFTPLRSISTIETPARSRP